ncbi:MAG TPA: HlyD family efflux transporter periplasmic adaptor subunit, partial [Gammaproteobacteria bacterium]|nr:HlyD family efflux transporter periplasmic adaptor subunit [Gammaproteobacteria bacterium]
LERQQSLFERKVIPESTVDHAVARHVQAMAKVASIQARMKKQQAQIRTAHANVASHGGKLLQAELELEHTLIRSPVDGIVINRAADTGQTVAASLQAPVLFTLAQDLRQIHLEVSVDEADIGGITEGQQARFSVDAYPDRVSKGEVVQIRKQPIEVSGVVTYVVIVGTQNLDQSLMPGMTASVEIVLGERQDALKVSSQALRFKPPGFKRLDSGASARGGGRERMRAMIKNLSQKLQLSEAQLSSVQSIYAEMGQSIRGLREAGMGGDEFREAIRQLRAQAAQRVEKLLESDQKKRYRLMRAEEKSASYRRANVWVLDGGEPVAVGITVGISDSTHTEIVRGDIAQGAQVIVGLSSDGS